jgi:hypothetical protein
MAQLNSLGVGLQRVLDTDDDDSKGSLGQESEAARQQPVKKQDRTWTMDKRQTPQCQNNEFF